MVVWIGPWKVLYQRCRLWYGEFGWGLGALESPITKMPSMISGVCGPGISSTKDVVYIIGSLWPWNLLYQRCRLGGEFNGGPRITLIKMKIVKTYSILWLKWLLSKNKMGIIIYLLLKKHCFQPQITQITESPAWIGKDVIEFLCGTGNTRIRTILCGTEHLELGRIIFWL